MDIDDIRQLALWLSAAQLNGLELQRPGFELRMRRAASAPRAEAAHALAARPTEAVLAPGLGHFFITPAGERKPLVSVGDSVQVGQLVALLQVGVVQRPVRSSLAGRVAVVLVGDGEVVGYGQPLIELESESHAH